MSKINQNKIISLFFGLVAFTLVFLSFQKNNSEKEIIIQKVGEKLENVASLDKKQEKNNSVTELQVLEKEELNKTEYEVDYLKYDLILNSKKITGIFIDGDSVYDSLFTMKEKGLVSFEDKNFSGLGSYVYSINGISENRREGKYWIYYVNGKKANVGVSNYLLKEKDEIRWQLENNT